MKQLPKISIIGSGNVGANAALLTAISGASDVVLIDIAEGLARGKAIDISQALAILGLDAKVEGHSHYAYIVDSKIVVVTAGLPRAPGMSRSDLLHKNGAIIKSIVVQIKKYAQDAIVIVVTNPLDVMTYLTWRETGFESRRVMGMGGLLDSGRFVYFLSAAAGVARSKVEGLVIGSHGDEMVPLTTLVGVNGKKPSEGVLTREALDEAAENTRHGGAEIVGLLKRGSAGYGPAAAISLMVKAILSDEKRIFPVCCLAHGEYDRNDVFLNLPAVLGANGVERIVELDISEAERDALKASAAAVRKMLSELR